MWLSAQPLNPAEQLSSIETTSLYKLWLVQELAVKTRLAPAFGVTGSRHVPPHLVTAFFLKINVCAHECEHVCAGATVYMWMAENT